MTSRFSNAVSPVTDSWRLSFFAKRKKLYASQTSFAVTCGKPKRFMTVLIALCLCLTFISSVSFADSNQKVQIPFGEDLRNYNPEIHGYYATIQLLAQQSENTSLVTQLPLLVFNRCVFVRTSELGNLFPLNVITDGNTAQLETENRVVKFSSDSIYGEWIVGSRGGSGSPFVKRQITFSAAPQIVDETLWIPLLDTITLLGMDAYWNVDSNGSPMLYIHYPERTALDILADLYDDSYRSNVIFSFPEELDKSLTQMAIGAGLATGVDSLMTLDISGFFAKMTGTDVVPLIDRLAGVSHSEDYEIVLSLLDGLNNALSTKDLLPDFSEMQKLTRGMDVASNVLLYSSVAAAADSYKYAYEKRDMIAIDALNLLKNSGHRINMGGDCFAAAGREIDHLSSSRSFARSHTLSDKWEELAASFAGNYISCVNTMSLISGFYSLSDMVLSELVTVWAETKESMEDFAVYLYGLPMEKDTEALLKEYLMVSGDSMSEEQMLDCLPSAYLFLKTCYTTREAAYGAAGYSEQFDESDLAILSRYYDAASLDEMMPYSIIENAAAGDYSTIIDLASPLYMRVNGQVLRKDTKEPVSDAKVEFTCDGETCGFISGTHQGIVDDVFVPVCIPKQGQIFPETLVLEASFTSPTNVGEDGKEIAYTRDSTVTMETAYLGICEFTGQVLDNDNNSPLENVMVTCISKGGENIYSSLTNENGQFDFDGIIPDEYTLYCEKDGYESTDLASVVQKDTVTVLLDPVRLQSIGLRDPVVIYYDQAMTAYEENYWADVTHLTSVEAENHRDQQEKMTSFFSSWNAYADNLYNEVKDISDRAPDDEYGVKQGKIYHSYHTKFVGSLMNVVAETVVQYKGSQRSEQYYDSSVLLNPVTGEKFGLLDLFIDDDARVKFITMLVNRLANMPDSEQLFMTPKEIAAGVLKNTCGSYTIDSDKLSIHFEIYEIGPHSIGETILSFSFDRELNGLINPAFLKRDYFDIGSVVMCTQPSRENMVEYGVKSGVGFEVNGAVGPVDVYRNSDLVLQANYLENAIVWLHGPVPGDYVLKWTAFGKNMSAGYTVRGTEADLEIVMTSTDNRDSSLLLDECDIRLLKDTYRYTGSAVLPQLEISYKGHRLAGDVYYTVSSDSVKPGKATAAITGIGVVSGSRTVEYTISSSGIALDDIQNIQDDMTGRAEFTVHTSKAEEQTAGKPSENNIKWDINIPEDQIQWAPLVEEKVETDGEDTIYYLSREFTVTTPGKYLMTIKYNGFTARDWFTAEPAISMEIGPHLADGTLAEGEDRTRINSYTDIRLMSAYDENDMNFVWQFMKDLVIDKEQLNGQLEIVSEANQIDRDKKIIYHVLRVKPMVAENDTGTHTVKISCTTDANQSIDREVQVSNGIISQISFRSDGKNGVSVPGSTSTILRHRFYYCDDFFYKPASTYNNDLSVMSLGLELASFTSPDADTDYSVSAGRGSSLAKKRAANLLRAFDDLDFHTGQFSNGTKMTAELYNYEIMLSDPEDKVAFAFDTKYISSPDSDDTLIAVVIRGGGYGAEWTSNFNVGNSGNHNGFQSAANMVEQALDEYVSHLREDGRIIGNLKIWVTGYSRGAAVANLLASSLNNRDIIGGVDTMPHNQYVYTFATPAGYRGTRGKASNIFNVVSENDIVPKLALESWGFRRYGTTLYLPAAATDPVDRAFHGLTGEKLEVKEIDDFENALINLLGTFYSDTETYIVSAQEYISDYVAESYQTVDGSFVSGFGKGILEGIKNDGMDLDLIPDAADIVADYLQQKNESEETYIMSFLHDYIAYHESNSDGSITDFLKMQARDAFEMNNAAVVNNLIGDIKGITSSQFHYPEYYLSWLETGGTFDHSVDFALLTNTERSEIGISNFRMGR